MVTRLIRRQADTIFRLYGTFFREIYIFGELIGYRPEELQDRAERNAKTLNVDNAEASENDSFPFAGKLQMA